MKFDRLRLVGFKTFVEPSDLVIEPGLTGVVGPNGCGKSNLVEALRWVMGEASHKAMRAQDMDDVIFSGTTGRPARNAAEVVLHLDNTDRTAPAAFNEWEHLEVVRRIERGNGSSYRINGRDVRARDVHLLFADASTGARSPALVRQGQIGEIVGAKPNARRRILEEAAGVAGLHARRHEAETRLRAAEQNLARLEDVILQMAAQVESLRRQARQSERYRLVAAEIRRCEAILLLLRWDEVSAAVAASERQLEAAARDNAGHVQMQAEAARLEALAAHALPGLRQAEAEAAAAVQRLAHARAEIDAEAARLEARQSEIARRLKDFAQDLAREELLSADAAEVLERLDTEAEALAADREDAAEAEAIAADRREEAEALLADAEAELEAQNARALDIGARRGALERALKEAGDRLLRTAAEKASVDAEEARLSREAGTAALEAARAEAEASRETLEMAEELTAEAEAAHAEARRGAEALRPGLAEAERAFGRLDAEARTLAKLLAASDSRFPPVADLLSVARGHEIALGAALGDDLDLPVDDAAPARWGGTASPAGARPAFGDRPLPGGSQPPAGDPPPIGARPAFSDRLLPGGSQPPAGDPPPPIEARPLSGGFQPPAGDPPLPPGSVALTGFVHGPVPVMARLARRLDQIGLVARTDGPRLAAQLLPGQRLVSREGDLWRWDGVVAAAEAPTAAARRLAERNRLADLEAEAAAARAVLDTRRAAAAAAEQKVRAAASAESQAREARRAAQRAADTARTILEAAERRAAQHLARLAALAEARARIAAAREEGESRRAAVESELALLGAPHLLESELARARAAAAEHRAALGEARAACDALRREAAARLKRLEAIAAERRSWQQRAGGAGERLAAMQARKAEAEAERDALAAAPAELQLKRRSLLSTLEAAEAARRAAADHLAEGEAARIAADRAARDTLEALSRGREEMARAEARREAARQRRDDLAREIGEAAEDDPAALRARAGLSPDAADLPDAAAVEALLDKARRERDRLGAVNLRADVELAEADARHTGLVTERDDLIEAIRRLRGAISSLNREARERLQASFVVVDAHFRSLFDTLFGGGEAELVLTDADDPLEAGLDIIARPPGKKPQTLSLLSGGEQALTAMALIFAVFLTNPAPICVLDEVDAPLDDANVERFCTLLEEMTRRTDTRFLAITHNPITMARMNRLFGVTMAERGVSKLVSVDLKSAEQMREAG